MEIDPESEDVYAQLEDHELLDLYLSNLSVCNQFAEYIRLENNGLLTREETQEKTDAVFRLLDQYFIDPTGQQHFLTTSQAYNLYRMVKNQMMNHMMQRRMN